MGHRAAVCMVLIAVMIGSGVPGHAATDPCTIDADLCLHTDADATCLSVGLWSSEGASWAYTRTQVKDTTSDEREYDNPRHVSAGFTTRAIGPLPPDPMGNPIPRVDVSVRAGVIESWCHSYTHNSNTFTKSCGEGKLGDVRVSVELPMEPFHVTLKVQSLLFGTCVMAEPTPLGPLSEMQVGRVILESGEGTFPMQLSPTPGTAIPLAPAVSVVFHERFNQPLIPGGCAYAGGAAMIVQSGASQIVLGLSSAMACQM